MNHLVYWKMEQSPFLNGGTKNFFYTGGSVDEAIARISFLCKHKRDLGVLVGPPGVGKSVLLRNLKWHTERSPKGIQPEFLFASTTGLQQGELPRRLLSTLRSGTSHQENNGRGVEYVWRDLEDASVGANLQEQRLVILLDEIDQASKQVWEDIARLLHLPGGVTCILACSELNVPAAASSVLDRCELRIDLPAWDLAQTADYFEWSLTRAGGVDDLFDAQAITRIQELSNGIPRRMNQLAELGLVSGAVRRVPYISGPMIEQVAGELPDWNSTTPMQYA